MNFDLVIGNPPFIVPNGKPPLFHTFIMTVAKNVVIQAWIIPRTWFHSDSYTKFRHFLILNGLNHIVMLPVTTFSDANVATCFVICKKGSAKRVEIILDNRIVVNQLLDSGIILPLDNQPAIDCLFLLRKFAHADPIRVRLPHNPTVGNINFEDDRQDLPLWLSKLTKDGPVFSHADHKHVSDTSDFDLFKLVTTDACGDEDDKEKGSRGLRRNFVVIGPKIVIPKSFMYIAMPDKKSAHHASRYFRSKLIGWILLNTRTGKRMTAGQFNFIPNPLTLPTDLLESEFLDEALINYFGISSCWDYVCDEMSRYPWLAWDEYGNRIDRIDYIVRE